MSTPEANSSFNFKGSQFTLPVLHLLGTDVNQFKKQLHDTVQQNINFFQCSPIIVDISDVSEDINFNLLQFHKVLREESLIPIGVRGAIKIQQEQAKELGLAVFNAPISSKSKKTKVATEQKKQVEKSNSIAKVITKPVRSGQQIYAQGSDLIILAPVSPGAEILADGHIHVYAPLRGRALAGILGDTSARIFCRGLEAELVSIAGRFLLSESITATKNSTQVFLEGDQIQIVDF